MNDKSRLKGRRSVAGFTLIELLVVVLIIGILAAIAVPQYFKVVEKGKSSEALTTCDSIRGAQERYLARAGNYCTAAFTSCTGWDMAVPTLMYYTVGTPAAGTGNPSWKMTMTRNVAVGGYGAYVITYDIEPGAQPAITCSNASCQTDLMPQ